MFRADRALHAMHKIAMQKAAAVGLPGESAPTTNPNAKAPPPPKSTGGPSIGSRAASHLAGKEREGAR